MRARSYIARCWWRFLGRAGHPRRGRPERPADRVDRQNAADPTLRVSRDDRAEPAEGLVLEDRLERGVLAHRDGATVAGEHIADGGRGALDRRDLVRRAAVEEAGEALSRIDDREPRPAVAQEVLVEGPLDRELLRDRDRLGIHHVRDRDALDPAGQL